LTADLLKALHFAILV